MTKITFLILSLFYFFVIHERSLHWNCLKLRLKRRTWPAVVDGGIKSSPAGWGIDCKAVFFFKPSVIIINYTLYYFTGKAWVTLLWHVNAGPTTNTMHLCGVTVLIYLWWVDISWFIDQSLYRTTLQMSEIFFLFLLMKFITQLIKLPVIKINPV